MPDGKDLMRVIGYCGHLGKQCMDLRLRQTEYNVTPVQSHVLHYLDCVGAEHPVTQRDLENEMGLKASTVNGIVSRLEEKGYITRRQSAADGRCRLVSLTEEGRQIVQTFQRVAEQADQAGFSGLSEAEQEQLRALLKKVILNLEKEVKNA